MFYSVFSNKLAKIIGSSCLAVLLFAPNAFAQRVVKGKVVDSKNEPVISAGVQEKGTSSPLGEMNLSWWFPPLDTPPRKSLSVTGR